MLRALTFQGLRFPDTFEIDLENGQSSKSRILIGVEAHELLKSPRAAAFQHPLCTRIATSASHAVTSFTVIGHKRPDPNDTWRDGLLDNLLLVVGVCNNIIVIAIALVLIFLQYEQIKGGGTNKLVWERRRQRAVFKT